MESGPGLVVCEPSGPGVKPDVLDFGAGCGRWLEIVAGGQPEFGKTPHWEWVDHVRKGLKLKDMRLSPADGIALARRLAATHVAVGTMEGDLAQCTLTYRVYAVATGTPVGAPLAFTGTGDELKAHLPQLARELAERLGVNSPHVPAVVGETVEELRDLGGFAWTPAELPPPEVMRRMRLYAVMISGHTVPARPAPPFLGAYLLLINRSLNEDAREVTALSAALTKELPQNALVFCATGLNSLRARKVDAKLLPTTSLTPLLAAYPHNQLLRLTDGYYLRVAANFDAGRKAVAEAVRCNRANPANWLALETVVGEQADAIRKGRTVDQVPPAEMKQCVELYAQQLVYALKAAEVSPGDVSAWVHVSVAAAFFGENELANQAYRRAEKLDPRLYSVVSWGMQLYQPKWLDDHAQLVHVAQLALAAANDYAPVDRTLLAIAMVDGGLMDEAGKMVRSDRERADLQRHIERHHQPPSN